MYALLPLHFFREAPTCCLSLCAVGVILAVLTGLLMKKTIYLETVVFCYGAPTYNLPRLRHILIHTWTRLKLFLFSAGKIIVIVMIHHS